MIIKFQEVWGNRISLKENLTKMGVSVDANNVVPKISTKGKLIRDMKVRKGVLKEGEEEVQGGRKEHKVISRLTKEAEFVAKQTFRFTPTQVGLGFKSETLCGHCDLTFHLQVQLISHMMDKHGEDWAAMARDPKNHYQETAAKLRGMVRKFISIPEQYVVFCKERGIIQPSEKPVEEEEEAEAEEMEDDEEEELLDPGSDGEKDQEDEDGDASPEEES